jgi:hypothetical protein
MLVLSSHLCWSPRSVPFHENVLIKMLYTLYLLCTDTVALKFLARPLLVIQPDDKLFLIFLKSYSRGKFQLVHTVKLQLKYYCNTDLGVVACALSKGRVEAVMSHFVEPTQDLASEVRGGSGICSCRPRDSNILADRKSGWKQDPAWLRMFHWRGHGIVHIMQWP